MDIRCSTCGEPWEMDCLHDEVQARFEGTPEMAAYEREATGYRDQSLYAPMYAVVREDFTSRGCKALVRSYGKQDHCKPSDRGQTASVIYDLLGDDLDGAASMLEDAEALGL